MSTTTDQSKPPGKTARRSQKVERGGQKIERGKKKKSQASPAPVELQSPDQDLELRSEQLVAESASVDSPPAANEPVEAVAALPEPETIAVSPEPETITAPVATAPSLAELAPVEPSPAEPAPAECAPAKAASTAAASAEPVSLQTIANAYRDYTRKSFEEFGSFFEQLSGVRTLDKAMTVQTEFVKRAYENSVAESQKICELHNRLARQTFQPFRGLVGMSATHRKP